ncbi:MAG: pyruvate ferredoxin oxidoreductase subunit gamma [Candidatus Hydrothermarchaeota archaeon]
MIEIRFHGRGGQGAVTAAQLLAEAAFNEEKFTQAFPLFGVERRGAPVMAFTRIDDKPIRIRAQIYNPDHVIVLDETLLEACSDLTDPLCPAHGIKDNGTILINSQKEAEDITRDLRLNVKNLNTVNATRIALETLGVPIVNTVILGAFIAFTDLIGLNSLKKVIKDKFPGKLAERNVDAIEIAFEEMRFRI